MKTKPKRYITDLSVRELRESIRANETLVGPHATSVRIMQRALENKLAVKGRKAVRDAR